MNHTDNLCNSLKPPGSNLKKVESGNLCYVVPRNLDEGSGPLYMGYPEQQQCQKHILNSNKQTKQTKKMKINC